MCLDMDVLSSPSSFNWEKWMRSSLGSEIWSREKLEKHPGSTIGVWAVLDKRLKPDATMLACHLDLLAPFCWQCWTHQQRGSPKYEVPTRPYTIWFRSPTHYDGEVSIILDIFLSSCCLTHESVIIVTSRKWSEYAWWVRNVTLCPSPLNIKREN